MLDAPARHRPRGRRDPWTAAATACLLAGVTVTAFGAFGATGAGAHPPPVPVVAGAVPAVVAISPSPAIPAAPHGAGMRRSAPLLLAIPAIGLEVNVQPVQLSPDGRVPLPADVHRAGWLATSASPGENGTAIIAGHVDSTTGPAAFYGLGSARPGMLITVARADAGTAVFTVVATAVYRKDRIPDDIVYAPTPGPSLHLITCTGWDSHTRSYREDLVVYATAQAISKVQRPANFR